MGQNQSAAAVADHAIVVVTGDNDNEAGEVADSGGTAATTATTSAMAAAATAIVAGAVGLRGTDTLADARRRIEEDGLPVPTDFQFVLGPDAGGAPVSSAQEGRRTVADSSVSVAAGGDRRGVVGGGVPRTRRLLVRAGPLDELRRCLGPLHHLDDALIDEQVRGFADGTRRWVFDAFDKWVSAEPDGNPHRVFVLAGRAGIGKTGIMCKLARDRSDVVVARHFCRHDDARRSDPRSMLLSIAYQLAVALPGYRRRIVRHIRDHDITRSRLVGTREYDTVTIFTELIQNILRDMGGDNDGDGDVVGSEGGDGGRRRRVILIDAIDECDHNDGNGILECIRKYFRNLPRWLGVFITTRPEVPIREKLRLFDPIEIEPEAFDNLADLRLFLEDVLGEDSVRARLEGSIDEARAVETLVRKSRGLFVYAAMAADALRAGGGGGGGPIVTQASFEDFPDGLDGFYQEQMERTFPDTDGSLSWEIVKLVVAAVEPLHMELVDRLVGCTEEQRRNAVLKLSRFFPVQGDRIQLYHKSLKDWLVAPDRSESQHHISLSDVEGQLARGCVAILREEKIFSGQKAGVHPSAVNEAVIRYPLRRGVAHLCSAGVSDEARQLVLDVGWLLARAVVGDSLGIVEDCHVLEEGDRVVELVGRAVSLAQHALRHDPRQLASQLIGRLLGSATTSGTEDDQTRRELNDFLERLRLYDYGWSWWCPITATWDQASNPCLKVLTGHSSSVRCVQWSHNGMWIASGSSDGTVRVWETHGECIQLFNPDMDKGKVNTLRWSNDDHYICCAYSGWGKVRIFDAKTGECKHALQNRRRWGYRSLSWSPDDQKIAVASKDIVLIIDAKTGDFACEIDGDEGEGTVWPIDWSHNGKWLAAGVERSLKIVDMSSTTAGCCRTHHVFKGHSETITTVAWSPDDSRVLSGSHDGTFRVWDIATQKCLQRISQSCMSHIRSSDWSSDERAVVFTSTNNSVGVWDLRSNEIAHIFRGHTGTVLSVSWAQNSQQVVSCSADHTIRIWDLTFDDSSTKRKSRPVGHYGFITSRIWTHDGRYLVTASVDKSIRVWDASTGLSISTLWGHSGSVRCVACSHAPSDVALIASGCSGKQVRLWKISTKSCLSKLEGHTRAVRSVAFSWDDLLLASASAGGNVRLWNVNTESCVRVLEDDATLSSITSVVFSHDGRFLATASVTERELKVWGVEEAVVTKVLPTGGQADVVFLAYSDDGKYLLCCSSDMYVSIIDASSGERKRIVNHSELSRYEFQSALIERLASFDRELMDNVVGVDVYRFGKLGNRAFGASGNSVQFFTLFEHHRNRSQGNKLAILQSDPLVYRHEEKDTFHALPRLNFVRERQLMQQCLTDASRDVELSFGAATTTTLRDAVINRIECVHFSGHGAPNYLLLEDGKGGGHFINDAMLEELYPRRHSFGKTAAPHKLVFISACHSAYLAKVFVDAGVDHVVCCQQGEELADEAAAIFMKTFFMSLVVGHTVKLSFEMGRQAVASGPFVLNSSQEKEKFVLLPEYGSHDVAILYARPIPGWNGGAGMLPNQWLPGMEGVKHESQVDMYQILNKILRHRLVTVIGSNENSRRSTVSATCHYINDRMGTTEISIDILLYLPRQHQLMRNRVPFLHRQLVAAQKSDSLVCQKDGRHLTTQDLVELLQKTRALLFIDEHDGDDEIIEFIQSLLSHTNLVKVLRTSTFPLSPPSLGIHEEIYELTTTSAPDILVK